ncbi:tumor necrosis factor ligand superfamily member 6 [Kryptolebias marmoratus]|uniref:Fas ligand (TNF superfamily, member 6) n=1 Tax=Kryptolebias marmoratus TaxID=37003 RepID=A0A3Q3AIF7_KRYMA|nr:tumor necrosis factor ligand superfamily member 6 [Kryptolebias marmoratus]
MNCDQRYPFPQVFLVDEGGGPRHSAQAPNLVPCWSFPPAVEKMRSRGKSRGCMGVSPSLAMVVLMLFLLVFAALGFEAWQILQIQKKMKDTPADKVELQSVTEFDAPLKQIGLKPQSEEDKNRPAAHVIGRIEKESKLGNTLKWDSKVGRTFTSGGVAYRAEDGALQVNKSGLYHIYTRVELIFRQCTPSSSFEHSVFVRRAGYSSPLTLMQALRVGFCPQYTGHSWTSESYLGSAQQLQKDDKVFVNVTHRSLLSHTHYANFFGLYLL